MILQEGSGGGWGFEDSKFRLKDLRFWRFTPRGAVQYDLGFRVLGFRALGFRVMKLDSGFWALGFMSEGNPIHDRANRSLSKH